MEAITKLNESSIRTEARRCIASEDVPGLGSIIERLERHKRDYLSQQRQEVAILQEIEQAQGVSRNQLAYEDPSEARRAHVERQFDIELHRQRVATCGEQVAKIEALLKDLRKESESVQARVLAASVVAEAQDLTEALAEAKEALHPFRSVIERIYGLAHHIAVFNHSAEYVKIPTLSLSGDPGIVGKLGELRLETSPELEEFARSAKKTQAA